MAPQESSLKASVKDSLNLLSGFLKLWRYHLGVCDFCQISPSDEGKAEGGED